jgi:release factor glutamine methyltransferase
MNFSSGTNVSVIECFVTFAVRAMFRAKKIIREKLTPLYPLREIESLTRFILEHVTGFTRMQMHLNQSHELSDAKIMQIGEILNRLANHEPIQYILGEADFYGLKLAVSPDVLIPRTETEELVDWIIREEKSSCKSLLDIGTGSGCIPIAISHHIPMIRIEGWDISEKALNVARLNAEKTQSAVDFQLIDILNPDLKAVTDKWDVIVSNPPYVLSEESAQMGINVVEFEPHLALFVPDHDPLIFYRAIAGFAASHLQPGGRLYFEINEKLGFQTSILLNENGFSNVQVRQDLQGKDRMIRASI